MSSSHPTPTASSHTRTTRFDLHDGQGVFVPAGADHRFVGYEQLAVLVVFERPRR